MAGSWSINVMFMIPRSLGWVQPKRPRHIIGRDVGVEDRRKLAVSTNAATPYGLDITRDGVIYVADGTAGSEGLTVINTRNGKILGHISGITGAHMIAVDRKGAIYVAEVRGMNVAKFILCKRSGCVNNTLLPSEAQLREAN